MTARPAEEAPQRAAQEAQHDEPKREETQGEQQSPELHMK